MSVKRIVGKDNKEVDVSSWLTHLPVSYFTLHFNTFFPQKNPIDYYYPQGEDITGAVQHNQMVPLEHISTKVDNTET